MVDWIDTDDNIEPTVAADATPIPVGDYWEVIIGSDEDSFATFEEYADTLRYDHSAWSANFVQATWTPAEITNTAVYNPAADGNYDWFSVGVISDAAESDNTGCFWIRQNWGLGIASAVFTVDPVTVNKGKGFEDSCGDLAASMTAAEVEAAFFGGGFVDFT